LNFLLKQLQQECLTLSHTCLARATSRWKEKIFLVVCSCVIDKSGVAGLQTQLKLWYTVVNVHMEDQIWYRIKYVLNKLLYYV